MEEAQSYDVVLQGFVAEGKDPEKVREALASLMKISELKAEELLQETKTRVVSEVDQASAAKYLQALENTGVVVVITPHVPPQAATPQSAPTPTQETQPAPTPNQEPETAPSQANAQQPAQTQAKAPQPAPAPVSAAAKTPGPTTPADPGNRSRNRPPAGPVGERKRGAGRSLPVVPVVAAGAATILIVAVVGVLLMGHKNPPRHAFQELANEMMDDVLSVNRVVMETRAYSDPPENQEDAQKEKDLSAKPVSTVIHEALRGTTGETIRGIQQEIDQSGLGDSINRSRDRIRLRLDEIETGVGDFSREFITAFEQLKWLFEMYERFVETALHPLSRSSIVEFMADYEFERSFFETEYLKVVSTVDALDPGGDDERDLFENARQRGMQLADESKGLSGSPDE